MVGINIIFKGKKCKITAEVVDSEKADFHGMRQRPRYASRFAKLLKI